MSAAPPSPGASRLAPLLLVLIVCGGHALASRSPWTRLPLSPWAAAELLVPGLFAQNGAAGVWPFDAPAPAAGHSLVWAALAPEAPFPPEAYDAQPATLASPFVGCVPLWLALAGLLSASTGRHRCRALALLLLALTGCVLLRQSIVIVAGLGLSAAAGLRCIGPADEQADVRPQLVAAGACVLLTVALIAVSLRAGFADDAQALQPLLSRLEAAARGRFDPGRLAIEAAHLRAVLDRAALAAFVGMTALLLHLKSRARWSAALLLLATAADLVSAAR